jgi:hypothetical protein
MKPTPNSNKLSLWLDDYSDIFSDFDPRPFSKRVLSDDFISEAKKLTRDNTEGFAEIYLQIPKGTRSRSAEKVVRKRLRAYFAGRLKHLQDKRKKILRQGSFFILLGVSLMVITTFILVNYYGKNFFVTLLSVIAEPAGWFLFWEGLNLMIFHAKEEKFDLSFNKKLSNCKIYFDSY